MTPKNPQAASEGLRERVQTAINILAERMHGNPARSPAHNARLILEDALAATPAIAPGGDGMSAWIGKLGALVSAAKDRDLSAKDHAEAIDKAHSELFDTLQRLPADANAVTVDDAIAMLNSLADETVKGFPLLSERLRECAAALAPAAQQDGHMELAVAIAAAKTADPPAAGDALPPLPKEAAAYQVGCNQRIWPGDFLYTADQMRAYALAAQEAAK